MRKRPIVSDEDLRPHALQASRSSFGFRRHRVADLIARAETFEAWLKTVQRGGDFQEWLFAKRALKLATEDSRFDRGQRNVRAYDTRAVLRRADAYRAYLAGSVRS